MTTESTLTAAPGQRRRRGGEPDFASYYGRAVLKRPTWKPLDIAGYLYLGGLAGASSLLAAGGQLTGRPHLARTGKTVALGAVSMSLTLLVKDLGRPARFVNMLRVFKPSSPMSVGSWLLAGYSPLAGVAAVTDLTGRFGTLGKVAGCGAALLGAGVATYTAVLISDTAVPAWHGGHREMPFLFAGSAAATAAGAALIAVPSAETAPVRRMALCGAALELVAGRLMRHRMGMVAETYERGTGGRFSRAAEMLTAAGAVGTLLAGGRDRAPAAVSGAALMAGSACLRFGVFHAGIVSTEDPKYTVVPQREDSPRAATGTPVGVLDGAV